MQAWEDKNQRYRTCQEEPDQSNTPPPLPSSGVPENSREPLNLGLNQPETEAQTDEARPRNPPVSPLFVPRDTISESYVPGESPRSPGVSFEETSHLTQFLTNSPIAPGVVPISSGNPGVFEYGAAFSIPHELRLPDEVEETSVTPYPAETLPCTENTDGLEVSERTPEPPHNIPSNLSETQSPAETLPGNPLKAVDEIPETPPGPVAEPENQKSPVVPTFPGIGLQKTGSLIDSRSIPGTGLSPSLAFRRSLPAGWLSLGSYHIVTDPT